MNAFELHRNFSWKCFVGKLSLESLLSDIIIFVLDQARAIFVDFVCHAYI